RLCAQPHADSHIEAQAALARFPNSTDSRYANLWPDTGHVAYAGGGSVALTPRYAPRRGSGPIHQMNTDRRAAVAPDGPPPGEAVKRGVCVDPPAGVPTPAEVVHALSELDAELFVIVEQDLYPCAPEVPLPIAIRTREYLNGCGLTGSERPRI